MQSWMVETVYTLNVCWIKGKPCGHGLFCSLQDETVSEQVVLYLPVFVGWVCAMTTVKKHPLN